MGHATTTNISQFINRQLRQGPVTVRTLVDAMVEKKMALQASEQAYTDAVMLGEATSQILEIMRTDGQVEPRPATRDQRRIWKQRERGEDVDWDCGNDGCGGEYGIFDSIMWHPLKKRFSVIRSISN
jgi:hypothetical protein